MYINKNKFIIDLNIFVYNIKIKMLIYKKYIINLNILTYKKIINTNLLFILKIIIFLIK